jgi:hypothetical protein
LAAAPVADTAVDMVAVAIVVAAALLVEASIAVVDMIDTDQVAVVAHYPPIPNQDYLYSVVHFYND